MPEGFEPHTELARIYTLRDLMQGCRNMAGEIIEELHSVIHSEDPDIKLRAMAMALDRGFGKPRQHHVISDMGNTDPSRVQLYIPSNGREVNNDTPIIDAETV